MATELGINANGKVYFSTVPSAASESNRGVVAAPPAKPGLSARTLSATSRTTSIVQISAAFAPGQDDPGGENADTADQGHHHDKAGLMQAHDIRIGTLLGHGEQTSGQTGNRR